MTTEVQIKKWGNSGGIVIPIEEMKRLNLKFNEKIMVSFEKKGNILKELFGAIKFGKSTQELLKESRNELQSKWLK